MIEDIEAALRADLESEWTEASITDRRTNTGYDIEGRTTSYAFTIRVENGETSPARRYELVVGPRAVRGDSVDAIAEALRERSWIERLREEEKLLLEKEGEHFTLGPRPDQLVL